MFFITLWPCSTGVRCTWIYAAHGLFAEHGLHRFRFTARGAQGIQVATADVTGMPIAAPNRAEMTAV